MTAFVAVICGVYGLVIGSFLNVVIYRVPRKESLVRPRSHCPNCETMISPRDNIPVVSWLLLRGRCRHCGERISVRYPLIELFTGVMFAAMGARFAHSWALPAYLVLTAALIALSAIDLEHYILPNRIIYPLGYTLLPLFALASLLEHDWMSFRDALVGAALAFAFFVLLRFISPRSMGMGDVRLSPILGLALGWLSLAHVLLGLFTGFLLGAVVGVGVMATVGVKEGRKRAVPFGPFLAAGTMLVILFGQPFIDWYTRR
jgi:leader peptidase (prepilin peptidase)/N-methyltransferase